MTLLSSLTGIDELSHLSSVHNEHDLVHALQEEGNELCLALFITQLHRSHNTVPRRTFTLWSTPISLANEERAPDGFRVNLSRIIYDPLLCLDNCSSLSFIIDTHYLAFKLKSPA